MPGKEANKFYRLFSDRNLNYLAGFIVLLGISLRLIFYFQNRCLFIDEANVARNIYERNFIELSTPLSYEQYAPPLFLWIIKCLTLVFGLGELSFRLFPLLCGIASLFLMYSALKKYTSASGLWYGLAIMATGVIYIRYSAELKQYICDVVVILSLLLMALRTDIFTSPRVRFALTWFLAGSVAIWLSMPSVFMLTGIGAYYLYQCARTRQYNSIFVLSVVGVLWLVQFAIYYAVILKPQIQSDYLQNCHKEFFLYPFPNTGELLDHDINVFNKLISAVGGKWALSVGFHLVTLIAGLVWLFRKETAKAILIVVPIVALIAAAMAHEYALTPRLILFIMPLFLILISTGVSTLFRVRFVAVKAIWIVIAAICITNFGAFSLFTKRMEVEEITKSMTFLKEQKVPGDHIYVHSLGGPAYLYYTTIHPQKEKWQAVSNAHILNWNSNYDSLGKALNGRSAILYSWEYEEEIMHQQDAIKQHHKQTAQYRVMGSSAFIYE